MKVKLTYTIKHEVVVDINPKDYCELHADTTYNNFFPKDARERELTIFDKESEDELDDYYFRPKKIKKA